MSVQEMKSLRERAKLTQAQMAERMGLGKTAYVDLELGDDDWKKFKRRHQLQLERASLSLALERADINLALPAIRDEALRLAELIRFPATFQVTGRMSSGYVQAGCSTAADAVSWGQHFFDQHASSVVIETNGRTYSVDSLREEIEAGRA